jgi:hypothetical protein
MSKQQPEWVDLPGAMVRADRVVAVEAVSPSSVVVHFSTGQRLPVEAPIAVVRAAFQDHARERRRDNEPKRGAEPERPRGID